LRKSERIRLLELEVTKINVEMQYLTSILSAFIEANGEINTSDLDAGKWYNRKPNRND
jgi:hypothetical protein